MEDDMNKEINGVRKEGMGVKVLVKDKMLTATSY